MTNTNSHHMGRNSAVPPNFSRKICPSFPSITRTSRRILISAPFLKNSETEKSKKQTKPPFFPNTMGYLRSSSPQTRTTRLLSQSRKSSYSSQRGKNLIQKSFYHKPRSLSIPRVKIFYIRKKMFLQM